MFKWLSRLDDHFPIRYSVWALCAIGLIASLDYLGLGVQPPSPDWGLMIQENQSGLSVTYWPVLIPVLAIAVLTIGTNLVTDGIARSMAGIDRRVDG